MCDVNGTEPVWSALEDYNFTKEVGCWNSNITCDGDTCTCDYKGESKGLNIGGLIGVIIFYLIILSVGLYAAWKNRRMRLAAKEEVSAEDVILAKRNINMFVGIMTMTATWVGGGYINGTSEITYASGFGWCQAPFGFSISLFVGGILFAKPMRSAGYTTMLDPFQARYGRVMGAVCFLPALAGELFWSSAILSALGSTLSVILHIDRNLSVIVSSIIAIAYTLCGGLLSVAYTDVVQLFLIGVGLALAAPFAAHHAWAKDIMETNGPCLDPPIVISDTIGAQGTGWIGTIATNEWGIWADIFLLLIFGGIPWQVYFQRVLSSKDAKTAQVLSFAAGIGCILLALPPAFIGAIAFSTDWTKEDNLPKDFTAKFNNATGKFISVESPKGYLEIGMVNDTIMPINILKDSSITLPLVLQYLTPHAISVIGLGSVAAAVMSSTDSSILGVSSMFTNNIYKVLFRPKASETELIWVLRAAICCVGAIALAMGLAVKSVYGLFFLCADFVYVILFPQIIAVLYIPFVNVYGSMVAFVVGLILRVGGGEKVVIAGKMILQIQPAIYYPYYVHGENGEQGDQLFPYKTFSMVMSFVSLLVISGVTRYLFVNMGLKKYDFCKYYHQNEKPEKAIQNGETNYALSMTESEFQTSKQHTRL